MISPTLIAAQEELMSEYLYRVELASIPDANECSQQEKDRYVARARAGDRKARETIIEHLLFRVASYARMYYATYSWQAPHFSVMDLIQVGNMAILENIDRVLNTDHTNPYGYLTVAAYQAIRHYSKRYSSMIVTPHTVGAVPLSVASLDAPLGGDDEGTLYDLVADTGSEGTDDEEETQPTKDYTPLYEALQALGESKRNVIIHHYGLFGHAPLGLQEINRSVLKRKGASSDRTIALDQLFSLLAKAYPHFRSSIVRPRLQPSTVAAETTLTREQARRIEQAHAALLQRGEKVTADRLRQEAHIAPHAVRAYLRQWQEEHPQETVEQRLERIYNELEATYGDQFTIEQLAKGAHVRPEQASVYFKTRRGPALSQDERLEQTYARMQAQGDKITVRTLGAQARVDSKVTTRWLHARRLAEGMQPIRNGSVVHWVQAS